MSENTFTPAAEPQAIDPNEAGQAAAETAANPAPAVSESEPAKADPVVAPAPTTAQAPASGGPSATAKPMHNGLSVDQRAYQQYQNLARVVLDSADLATKSAEAAAHASSQLRQANADFKELTTVGHHKARLLLFISSGVMVVSVIFFLIMGVRLISKINQLDALLMAVGKRVVELNVGMESLEGVNQSVKDLTSQQLALTKSQGQIEGRIDASLKQSESLVQKVPSETAKQVAASSESVIKQVQGMNSKLQNQANAVQSLGNEVKSLKASVGNVEGLKRDVQALVTLQKEGYLEAVQKNAAANATKERAGQYPRYGAAKSAQASPPTPTPASPATVKP